VGCVFFVSVHLTYDIIESEPAFLNIIYAMYGKNDKVKVKRPLSSHLRHEKLVRNGRVVAFLYGFE